MLRARLDRNGWIRCGQCGHKLMWMRKGTLDGEIKCHSCRLINLVRFTERVGDDYSCASVGQREPNTEDFRY